MHSRIYSRRISITQPRYYMGKPSCLYWMNELRYFQSYQMSRFGFRVGVYRQGEYVTTVQAKKYPFAFGEEGWWHLGLNLTHRTHVVMIMSALRQNDVVTSFWRNSDVIITSCVRWVRVDFFKEISKGIFYHFLTFFQHWGGTGRYFS